MRSGATSVVTGLFGEGAAELVPLPDLVSVDERVDGLTWDVTATGEAGSHVAFSLTAACFICGEGPDAEGVEFLPDFADNGTVFLGVTTGLEFSSLVNRWLWSLPTLDSSECITFPVGEVARFSKRAALTSSVPD